MNGTTAQAEKEAEAKTDGEVDAEEIDGMDILKSLETHVSGKRGLLEANEDDLDADSVADLTDKRMTFARTISPIKKVLFYLFLAFSLSRLLAFSLFSIFSFGPVARYHYDMYYRNSGKSCSLVTAGENLLPYCK